MGTYGSAYSRNTDFWSIQREKVGIGLQDLAQKVGVVRLTLNNWFRGAAKPRDRSYIYKLCKCLQIDYYTGLSKFDMQPLVFADTLAKNNITAIEIREVLGLTKDMVYNYLHGRNYPDHNTINAVADLCGIDRSDFFRELNNERLSKQVNTDKLHTSTEDSSVIVGDVVIMDDDKIETNDKITNNADIVKELFNLLYDAIDIDDLFLLIKAIRDSGITNMCWDDILDFIYQNKSISRKTYDSLICYLKKF